MESWEWSELFKDAVAMIQEPAVKQLLKSDELHQENCQREEKLKEMMMKNQSLTDKDIEMLEELFQIKDVTSSDCSRWSFVSGIIFGFHLAKITRYK